MSHSDDGAVDDEYDSEADEDFNLEAAEARQAPEVSSSDEDGDAGNRISNCADKVLDFDNSGDEATITKGGRKRKRLASASATEKEEDTDVIKTRAQRKLEQGVKKAKLGSEKVSVNVDALWAQMSVPSSTAAPQQPPAANDTRQHELQSTSSSLKQSPNLREAPSDAMKSPKGPQKGSSDEPMIAIKRKIEFAGQVTEEERQVPASSAEAKLFLGEQKRTPLNSNATSGLRRPKKRKSQFDQPQDSGNHTNGKKLTTLEKSKLDWAAQVDKEGIANELEEQSRGKTDYLGRMAFLGRMDARYEANQQFGGAG